MIELQHIIDSKRELLSRETYSRNPINYSEGMADDQKDRYIQYLAEQNQDLRLTNDAMKLVLEDFMVQMKELKDQVSSMQSKQSDLENRLSEERKLRQSAERIWKTGYQKSASFANRLNGRQRLFRKDLILPIRNVLETGVKGYTPRQKRVLLTGKRRKMIMTVRTIHSVRIL